MFVGDVSKVASAEPPQKAKDLVGTMFGERAPVLLIDIGLFGGCEVLNGNLHGCLAVGAKR